MNKPNKRVTLLKDEFEKYSKKNPTIGQDGFELIGKDLGIDIYSDVSYIFEII